MFSSQTDFKKEQESKSWPENFAPLSQSAGPIYVATKFSQSQQGQLFRDLYRYVDIAHIYDRGEKAAKIFYKIALKRWETNVVENKYFLARDLFEYIEQNGSSPEADCRVIFGQIVAAVRHLARHRIVHRDIKDENILIDPNLRIQLRVEEF